MTDAIGGRATARFPEKVYEASASQAQRNVVNYPVWMKSLFVGGLLVFLASMIGVMLSPIVGSGTSVTVLWITAAAGVAALWIVVKIARRHHAG